MGIWIWSANDRRRASKSAPPAGRRWEPQFCTKPKRVATCNTTRLIVRAVLSLAPSRSLLFSTCHLDAFPLVSRGPFALALPPLMEATSPRKARRRQKPKLVKTSKMGAPVPPAAARPIKGTPYSAVLKGYSCTRCFCSLPFFSSFFLYLTFPSNSAVPGHNTDNGPPQRVSVAFRCVAAQRGPVVDVVISRHAKSRNPVAAAARPEHALVGASGPR